MAPARETTSGQGRKPSSRRPVRAGTNAPRSEKAQALFIRLVFNRTFLAFFLGLVSIIAIMGATLLWFNKAYTDPRQVFWGMVDNNLATKGVVKQIQQTAEGNSTDELIQLSWNPNPLVRDTRQMTYSSTNPPTKVTLEAIGTPTDTYQHYSFIEQPGQQRDYSDIYKLWLKNGGTGQPTSPELFNNSLLGVFLFGNFWQPDRKELVAMLRDSYGVDFAKVERGREDGRRIYTYELDIKLKKYAQAAQAYAKKLGISVDDFINPSNIQENDNLKVSVTVDVLSRQIVKIVYQPSGAKETYSHYGIVSEVELPAKTVSAEDFQKAINSIAQ